MMRKTNYKKYSVLALFLFFMMSLPFIVTEKMRNLAVSFFSPIWKITATSATPHSKTEAFQLELKRLESENHLLRLEVVKLKALVEQQAAQGELHKEASTYALKESGRRFEECAFLQKAFSQAVAAEVIYRDPAHWSSALWVGVGEETNEGLGKKIIQKNSPVVVGRGVVGVIDYVGKKQARVRLLTDFGLKLSVRACRGYPQRLLLAEHIEVLEKHLTVKVENSLSSENVKALLAHLQTWKDALLEKSEGWYLAKGIIQGSSSPLWRRAGNTLRGIGFNYDFADDEGPARDLTTGKPMDPSSTFPPMPLLKLNDLLLTTGMDGVFPPGLRVGEVTKIYPLNEGGYTFDIEAIPILGHLDELSTVFILPPVGFDAQDQ